MYLFNPNRIYILIVIKGLAAVSLSLSPSKSTFDSFFGSKDPLGSRPNPCTTVCKTKNRHYSLRIKNRNRNIPIVSVSSTQKYRFRNLLQMRHIFQYVYKKSRDVTVGHKNLLNPAAPGLEQCWCYDPSP